MNNMGAIPDLGNKKLENYNTENIKSRQFDKLRKTHKYCRNCGAEMIAEFYPREYNKRNGKLGKIKIIWKCSALQSVVCDYIELVGQVR